MPEKMPAWFLAHGAPSHITGQQPVTQFWKTLPESLPRRPRAILCLSAHWLTDSPTLSGDTAKPEIQYDFYGFPDELYQYQWPLISDEKVANQLSDDLKSLFQDLQHNPARELDHGVWVPLSKAWPTPDLPVFQLSLSPDRGALYHVELGQKLAKLREQDVLIIGSGGLVHNLSRLDWKAASGQASGWAEEFMLALETAMAENDIESLCDPWSMPNGRECVPTMEHYLPLLVILGLNKGKALAPFFRDWEFGSLAMHSYITV